jgi:hypothetical protein
MDLPPGWHLSIEDRPSPAARNRLGRELGKHNRPYLRNARWQWLGACRPASPRHRPGIAAPRRGPCERGCHSAWLDTFSFQAPEFYPKFGYREFGRLDYPPDQQRIFFQKRLMPEG